MSESTTMKRTIVEDTTAKKGLTTQDLILIAVLLAAGAVLKLTVASFLSFAGMKPNFVIAMYCLAIILTRPKLPQAIVIGLIAGIMCQIPMLNATPLVNIPSEVLGALACGLLINIPLIRLHVRHHRRSHEWPGIARHLRHVRHHGVRHRNFQRHPGANPHPAPA